MNGLIKNIKSGLNKVFFCFENKRAFTLIELILVVAIIAVIAAVVIVVINPNRRIGEVNDSRRWSDITAIAKALEFYTADYGSLPSEFATSTVPIDGKVVLCSASASLTCDDQTRGCLVVSDANFLGAYLPVLPVDPLKDSTTDTGYYFSRNSNGTISIGACGAYNNSGLATVAKVELPAHIAVCGDGEVTGDEVCDPPQDAGYCGDGITQNGYFCNSTCSGLILRNESCDYSTIISCSMLGGSYLYVNFSDPESGLCKDDCSDWQATCLE